MKFLQITTRNFSIVRRAIESHPIKLNLLADIAALIQRPRTTG